MPSEEMRYTIVYVHNQPFSEHTSNFLLKTKVALKGSPQQLILWVSPIKYHNDMVDELRILTIQFANLTKAGRARKYSGSLARTCSNLKLEMCFGKRQMTKRYKTNRNDQLLHQNWHCSGCCTATHHKQFSINKWRLKQKSTTALRCIKICCRKRFCLCVRVEYRQ